MTDAQLQLLDAPAAVPEPPKLTPRQAFALRLVAEAGPDGIHADEVGAGWDAQRGKHHVEARCQWCGPNGKQVLDALKKKGLVRYRRRKPDGTGGDWIATGPLEAAHAHTPGMLADDQDLPF